jgi:hypothetical protein
VLKRPTIAPLPQNNIILTLKNAALVEKRIESDLFLKKSGGGARKKVLGMKKSSSFAHHFCLKTPFLLTSVRLCCQFTKSQPKELVPLSTTKNSTSCLKWKAM